MKKFKFSLQKILEYKEHIEENEKNVLRQLNAHLAKLLEQKDELTRRYKACLKEHEEKCKAGITLCELAIYRKYIKELETLMENKDKEIQAQMQRIQKQMNIVNEAVKEKKTLDKLRERQMLLYNDHARKAEELFIEEFVSNRRVVL